jgi:hypothetical protein
MESFRLTQAQFQLGRQSVKKLCQVFWNHQLIQRKKVRASVNKKLLVGIGASISTLFSAFLWVWYASIPSFDKSDKQINLMNETFQSESINNEK